MSNFVRKLNVHKCTWAYLQTIYKLQSIPPSLNNIQSKQKKKKKNVYVHQWKGKSHTYKRGINKREERIIVTSGVSFRCHVSLFSIKKRVFNDQLKGYETLLL